MINPFWHVGRSFTGHPLEDACPCPQEPCGLVSTVNTPMECPEHSWSAARTLRQGHAADNCPGAPA